MTGDKYELLVKSVVFSSKDGTALLIFLGCGVLHVNYFDLLLVPKLYSKMVSLVWSSFVCNFRTISEFFDSLCNVKRQAATFFSNLVSVIA